MEPSTRCFRKQPCDVRTERISWRTVQRRLGPQKLRQRLPHVAQWQPAAPDVVSRSSRVRLFSPKKKTPRTATPNCPFASLCFLWSLLSESLLTSFHGVFAFSHMIPSVLTNV